MRTIHPDTADSDISYAVTHWINGNDAEACRLLSRIQTQHSRNLLSLITKPQIHVLAQLPWITKGTQDILSGAEFDPKFVVKNIGFKPQDLQNRPYANIHDFYDPDDPPDFYISQMVEWHLTPPNIQELPCPIFGQTSDYDLHIQVLHPWLALFDELIVNGPDEQDEVNRLSGVPVTAYPKTFSIPDTLPPLPPPGKREIDFFMSGTTFHPYHHDKAHIVNRILDIPDFMPLFYNGFLSAKAYYGVLSHSKMALTFVRHADAMPTRGLESLAMGCALVVQRQSVLTRYLGEEEGIVTYDHEKDDLQDVMMRIKREWPLFEQRARRGSEIVRREFSAARVASEYLRFLTVLAAKPRPQRRMRPIERLDQKRSILTKGWGWPHKAYKELISENTRRWTPGTGFPETPSDINNLARDYVLDYSTWACPPAARSYPHNTDYHEPGEISYILDCFRQGIARFPRSLVLHFNLIRTALHFGKPAEVQEALIRGNIAAAKMESYWQLSPMDDVMPWDYFSQTFNYRSYFDLITGHLKGERPLEGRHVRLVLASINYYLSHYTNQVEHLGKAAELDPDFPFYRYRLALELLNRGNAGDCDRAGALLEGLVENSMLFVEAFPLLEKLVKECSFRCGKIASFRRKYRRAPRSMFTQHFQVDDWLDHYLRATAAQGGRGSLTYPRTLTQLARSVLNAAEPAFPASGEKAEKRILLIYQESTTWALAQHQRHWSAFGIEEALKSNGIDCVAIPAYSGISPRHSASWLSHVRTICEGKEFQQVWVEIAPEIGKDFLETIATFAPVRVAILPETVYPDREDCSLHPRLVRRRLVVEEQLRYMTHAVTSDERDAEILNSQGVVKALWAPDAVPAWSVTADVGAIQAGASFYFGEERIWLIHPLLKEFLTRVPSPVEESSIPALFDRVHATLLTGLHRGKGVDEYFLHACLDPLRIIRRQAVRLWADAMRRSPVIVNLPSPIRTYSGKVLIETTVSGKPVFSWDPHSGRVLEAMAAGRPVISWEIPNRPKTKALFADGEEILLFPPTSPEVLAAHLARMTRDPEECTRIASRALENVRRHHTLELRLRQVLEWIEKGIEPAYGAVYGKGVQTTMVGTEAASYDDDISSAMAAFNRVFKTEISSEGPAARPVIKGRTREERINLVLEEFQQAISRKDVAHARTLLEDASSQLPQLNEQLAYLYFCTGDDERSLTRYLAALAHNPCDPEVLKSIGLLSLKLGLYHEAALYFRTAMSCNPAADDVIYLLETLKTIEESEYGSESGLP